MIILEERDGASIYALKSEHELYLRTLAECLESSNVDIFIYF